MFSAPNRLSYSVPFILPDEPALRGRAVEAGRGAATFLATESTGTVLIPRHMTWLAGHVSFHFRDTFLSKL